MTSSQAASLFLLFAAMTQWPVVEKIVRLPPAPIGSTKSHLNGSFSRRKTGSRSGSSWRNADPAGLEQRDARLAVVLADRRLDLVLEDQVDVGLQRLRAAAASLNVTFDSSVEMMSTPRLWMSWYRKYQVKSLFVIGTLVAPDARAAELLHLRAAAAELGRVRRDVG